MALTLCDKLSNTEIKLMLMPYGIAVVEVTTLEGTSLLSDIATIRAKMLRDLAAHGHHVKVWVVNFENALLTLPGQRLPDVLRTQRHTQAAPEPTALVVRIEDARDFQQYARGLQSGGLDRIIFSARERASALVWARAVLDSQAVVQNDAQPTESAPSP